MLQVFLFCMCVRMGHDGSTLKEKSAELLSTAAGIYQIPEGLGGTAVTAAVALPKFRHPKFSTRDKKNCVYFAD